MHAPTENQTQQDNQDNPELSWLKTLDPEVVKLVTQSDVKVETKIGDIDCKLDTMCQSALLVIVEALVNRMRPVDLLRYCIVCKTRASVIFDRFIKCVEVREDGYLFVVRTRDGDLRLIFEDLDDAFDEINRLLSEHHHFAVDDRYYDEFERLTYARVTTC